MNTQLKSILIGGLVGGIVYAVVMAGFDYYDGENFRIWRFVFNFLFFGTFTGFSTLYSLKKQSEKEKEN